VLDGAPDTASLQVRWRDRLGEHETTRQIAELRGVVLDVVPGRRIGYVTDLRFTEPNLRTLEQLLRGVDQIFIESVFLDANRAHATRKNHLTARQAGMIAREVGARAVVPFHFSPRYEGRAAALNAELLAAWSGAIAAVSAPTTQQK
jgi:ribonuclease Z